MKTLLGNYACSAAAHDENDAKTDLQDNSYSEECSDMEADVANYEDEDISNNSIDKQALLFIPTVAGITGKCYFYTKVFPIKHLWS